MMNEQVDKCAEEISAITKEVTDAITAKWGEQAAAVAYLALTSGRTANSLALALNDAIAHLKRDDPVARMALGVGISIMMRDFGEATSTLIGMASQSVEALREDAASKEWSALVSDASRKTLAVLMRAQALMSDGAPSATLN